MRTALLATMFLAASVAVAAPVPKGAVPAKPAKLTAALLAGSWQYEWSGSLHGWIRFEADGTYTAQHDPNGTTVYSGTWSVGEGSITIVEWAHHTTTGTTSGPQNYRFDVSTADWPAVTGRSTSGYGFDTQVIPEATQHLKLSGRK